MQTFQKDCLFLYPTRTVLSASETIYYIIIILYNKKIYIYYIDNNYVSKNYVIWLDIQQQQWSDGYKIT